MTHRSSTPPSKRLAPTGFTPPDRATAAEFWVVRHGESTWNADGRCQGQTDVPLSALGALQAASLAERLTGQSFDAVYSSDLARARQDGESDKSCWPSQRPSCWWPAVGPSGG